MGQTIAEAIWEEGVLKGQLEATREILQILLSGRFGPLPEGMLLRIESCTDLQRLKAAVLQVARLDKPVDLQL
jgi:hypothetical protein